MKKIVKRFLSVICALALFVTAVLEPSWLGMTESNVDEVNAADTEPPVGFTEIGWDDLGLEYQKYESTAPATTRGEYTVGATLDRTLFNDDIIMTSGTAIRYGGSNGEPGIRLEFVSGDGTSYIFVSNQLNPGNAQNVTSGSEYLTGYNAATIGTEVVDKQINLKISTEIVDGAYRFGVWVNDVMVGGYITIVPTSGWEGNYVGLESNTGSITLVKKEIAPPIGFTEIGWDDLGLEYQKYENTTPATTRGLYTGGENLNRTLFDDDIIMTSGTAIRYGGSNGEPGIRLEFVSGDGTSYIFVSNQLNPGNAQNVTSGSEYLTGYNAATIGTEVVDKQINLKISTEIVDGAYRFGVWVNDVMVGGYITIVPTSGWEGNYVGLESNTGSITLVQKSLTLPSDFTEITWADFNLAEQEYADVIPESGGKGEYAGDSLNQTLLSGDIRMGANTYLRYSGNNGWQGLHITVVEDESTSYIAIGSNGLGTVVSGSEYLTNHRASKFNLNTLVDQTFNLKISTEISGYYYRFGIWVNDVMIGGYITLKVDRTLVGNVVGLVSSGSSITLGQTDTTPPIGFKEIGWSDFTGLEYKEYPDKLNDLATHGQYSGESLHRTLLNDDIILGAGSNIRYGGNGWQGLYVAVGESNGIGTITLSNEGFGTVVSGDEHLTWYYASDFGSSSFVNQLFNIKISTEISEEGNYTYGVWINDIMVGGYITITPGENVAQNIAAFQGAGNNITLKKTVIELPTDFTEISWTDFEGISNQKYADAAQGTIKGAYTGGSLHQTLLNGDITMGVNTYLRYGGKNGEEGLDIKVVADASTSYLVIGANGLGTAVSGVEYLKLYAASTLEPVDSFVDQKFNLKISTEISGDYYRFGIWVNDVMLGGYITLEVDSTKVGNMLGVISSGGSITLAQADSEPPTDFTKLSWTDFEGLQYKAYPDIAGSLAGNGTYGSSLHETLLNDRVIFGENTEIRYGGQAWGGLVLRAVDQTTFEVRSVVGNTDTSLATFESPSDYGLTYFANEEFNLKISTEIEGTSYTFGVWINDVIVDYYTIDLGENGGSIVGLYGRSSGNSITLKKQEILPPTDFTILGWNDFTGLICKEYVAPYPDTVDGVAGTKGTYSESIHQTLLDGNIIFEPNTELRYDGNGWNAVSIRVADEEITVRDDWNGVEIGTFEDASLYGLTSFTNEEFNLKISTEINGDVRTYGIWINNHMLGDYFTVTRTNAVETGSVLSLYHNGSGNNVQLVGEKVPTDYTILTPLTSFGIASVSYTAENGAEAQGSNSAVLEETGITKFDKVILQFHKITFDGNVDLGFGGQSIWVGFRLRSNATDGSLTLQSGYTGVAGYNQLMTTPIIMTDAVAGVDLVGGTYNLKISMVYTDDTTLKMGLWFDDILYNNEYFTIDLTHASDYASGDAIGTWLGVLSQTGGGTITFGEEEITLPELYWNKADGTYTLPSTTTDGEGNSITELTTVGDYYITYSSNGRIYERYVYIWEIGNVKVDNKVDVRDLVRTKKLSAGAGGDTINSGKEAADFDKNGTVDSTDVESMRKLLLGESFNYEMALSEKLLGAGNANVMPIVGYYGPETPWTIQAADGNFYTSQNTATEEIYKLIADMGINLITASNDTYTDSNKAVVENQLTLAQANGLSMFVRDGRISGTAELSHEELQRYLDGYQDYESFAGLFLVDEPRSSTYPNTSTNAALDDWSALGKKTNQYGDLTSYVNLYPYYEGFSSTSTKTAGYQAYLTEYIEKFKPQYLSFDYYLFSKVESYLGGFIKDEKDATDCEEYMQNLAMIRSAAKNAGIPFWSFVQAGSNWNDNIELMDATTNNEPSKGEFKWQANIALAMGAKGITYFPLIQPHYFALTEGGTMDYDRNGLIAADGSTTVWYDYAKELNSEIAAVDEILMNATNKGIITSGGYAASNITSSLNSLGDTGFVISSYKELTGVSTTGTAYGAVVGCFDYNGKTALYVVNYDVKTSRDITLNFSESVTADVTISGTTTEKSGSSMKLSLGAGEGALVVLK